MLVKNSEINEFTEQIRFHVQIRKVSNSCHQQMRKPAKIHRKIKAFEIDMKIFQLW